MITSSETHQSLSGWSMLLAIVVAFLVAPFGLAQAQDFKKVEKNLRKLIKKGAITERQAEAMMGALAEMAEEDEGEWYDEDEEEEEYEEDEELEERKEYYIEAAEKMKRAVKSGKLSEKEAEQWMSELREKLFGDEDDWEDEEDEEELEERKAYYEEAAEKMERAVKNGRISEEDAERALLEMKKELFGGDDEDAVENQER